MSRQLTDAQKLWVLLRDAGVSGVHTWDAAELIPSKNVSQRAKDIASKGVALCTAAERRNGRAGSRLWLAEHAPDYAVAVRPNGVEGDSGGDPCHSHAAVSLGTEPINLVCDATDRTDIRWREERIAA